jgi:ribosomal protein S18 acetylase RimI-like enzyme
MLQYSVSYYLNNLATWPDLFSVQEGPDGTLMGYGSVLPFFFFDIRRSPFVELTGDPVPLFLFPCANSDGQDRRSRPRLAVAFRSSSSFTCRGVLFPPWVLALKLNRVWPLLLGATTHSGHVTAITVSPSYRRIGLAKGMMVLLEKMSDLADAWFVDLYVRVSNERAYRVMVSVLIFGFVFYLPPASSLHRGRKDPLTPACFAFAPSPVAIKMYESMGYSVFRRVRGYYSGGVRDQDEDAFGSYPAPPLPPLL